MFLYYAMSPTHWQPPADYKERAGVQSWLSPPPPMPARGSSSHASAVQVSINSAAGLILMLALIVGVVFCAAVAQPSPASLPSPAKRVFTSLSVRWLLKLLTDGELQCLLVGASNPKLAKLNICVRRRNPLFSDDSGLLQLAKRYRRIIKAVLAEQETGQEVRQGAGQNHGLDERLKVRTHSLLTKI